MHILVMVAEAVFMIAGFLFGQIRTLQRLGFLANIAVWVCYSLYPLTVMNIRSTSDLGKAHANIPVDECRCHHHDNGCMFEVWREPCGE